MRKSLRFIVLSAVRASLVCALCAAPVATTFAEPPRFALAHHSVSTPNTNAQREFDEGLTLIYAFNPEEATFHFQAAARSDSRLAMAYWGIALAAGPNVNTIYDLRRAAIGRAAIAQAQSLPASLAERRYIAALAHRYTAQNDAQVFPAQVAYADAMRALVRSDASDIDARVLCAESLMDLTPLDMWHGAQPNSYTREVIGLLQTALARDPDQLGANHYLIHAYEDAPDPQAALGAARHLATLDLPPGAEHLAHMPAHIFTRVGDFDAAIRASLRAIALFSRYLPQEHSDVHNGYEHHDYQVLGFAYAMSGQWSKARANAAVIAQQVNDSGAAVETYLRFHKWRELIALPAPAQPGLRYRFALALAMANTHDLGPARVLIAAIDIAHDAEPRTRIARAQLAAAIDIAEHHPDAAIGELKHAVIFEDGLPSKEPPAWYYPIRETLGARLALAGKPREAAAVFDEDLKRNPNNPRSLFGLSQALRSIDRTRAARAASAFHAAWLHADLQLTLNDL